MAIRRLVSTRPAWDGTPWQPNPAARYETPDPRNAPDAGEGWTIEVTYEGAVVGTYEENGYDDSDFVAVVVEGDALRHITYASTRFWTYANSATVDATPEALEVAWAAVDRVREQAQEAAAAYRAQVGEVGDEVTVTGGRKHKGVTGTIAWVGASYGRRRYGITPDDGGDRVWVDAHQTDRPYEPGDNIGVAYGLSIRGVPPRPATTPA